MSYDSIQVDILDDILTFGLFDAFVDTTYYYQFNNYASDSNSLSETTELIIAIEHSKNKISYSYNSFSIDYFFYFKAFFG